MLYVTQMLSVLGSIPSPDSGQIEIFGVPIRAYGILLGLAVLAAVWVTQQRWAAAGRDPEDIVTIAMWAVPAGIVGARIYHVATDFSRYRDDLFDAFKVWEGGLGIWGAIAGGAIGAIVACRRNGYPVGLLADAIAPALLVAQAIGRFGNYMNQELFGRPTDLPWALEIDADHRPDEFLEFSTFHPTFLYEAIWNVTVAVVIIVFGDRLTRGMARGAQFALYVMGYTAGRLAIELVRIDPATELFGQRVNVWTSIVVFLGGLVALWILQRRGAPADGTDLPGADPQPPTTDVGDEVVVTAGDGSEDGAGGDVSSPSLDRDG